MFLLKLRAKSRKKNKKTKIVKTIMFEKVTYTARRVRLKSRFQSGKLLFLGNEAGIISSLFKRPVWFWLVQLRFKGKVAPTWRDNMIMTLIIR